MKRKTHDRAVLRLLQKQRSRSYAQLCAHFRTYRGDDRIDGACRRLRKAGLIESMRVPRPRWFITKKGAKAKA